MTAARAIATLAVLGLVAIVVMAAVGAVYALISLATWPRRIRARRRNTRTFAAHAAAVIDGHFPRHIPTQRSPR